MLTLSKDEIVEALSCFVWDFKLGDNIVYNLKILFSLYDSRQTSSENPDLFNKPLTIIIVGIIEAIFFDLVCRLDLATSHFPSHIGNSKRTQIKARLNEEKVIYPKKSSMKRVRNYKMAEFVKLFLEFELLGPKDAVLYDHLSKAAKMRNRIHISNYYRNFEIDESDVFTDRRLTAIEKIMEEVLGVMGRMYIRPFNSQQKDAWLYQLTSA